MTAPRPTPDALLPAPPAAGVAPADAGTRPRPGQVTGAPAPSRSLAAPLAQVAATTAAAAASNAVVVVVAAVLRVGAGRTVPLFWVLLLLTLLGAATLTPAGSPLTVRRLPRVGWAVLVLVLGWTSSLAVRVAVVRHGDGSVLADVAGLWLVLLTYGVVAAVLSGRRMLLLWAVGLIVAASVVVAVLGPGEVPAPSAVGAVSTPR